MPILGTVPPGACPFLARAGGRNGFPSPPGRGHGTCSLLKPPPAGRAHSWRRPGGRNGFRSTPGHERRTCPLLKPPPGAHAHCWSPVLSLEHGSFLKPRFHSKDMLVVNPPRGTCPFLAPCHRGHAHLWRGLVGITASGPLLATSVGHAHC